MIDFNFIAVRGDVKIHFTMNDEGLILLSGPNGAGKTTSLLCIAGILAPESGKIIIDSSDLIEKEAGKRRVVYINQNSYFSGMTVSRHLSIAASEHADVNTIASDFSLDLNSRISDLSQGNRMRVAFATAILSEPSLILMDETISNISNPDEFMKTVRMVRERHSLDIIFVSQNEKLSELFDHHYTISNGETSKIF